MPPKGLVDGDGASEPDKAPDETTAPRPNMRRWQVAVSAGVLAVVAWVIDWREFTRIAVSAEPELLLLAAGLVALGNLAIAWRWQLLLVPVGIRVSVLETWRSYLKGHFVAHFVPSGIAADVVKGWDMHRFQVRAGRSRGVELVSSIFLERAFGVTTVAIAVLAGLAMSPLTGQAELKQDLMLSAAALVVCCAFAFFFDRVLSLVPGRLLGRMKRLNVLVARARASFAAYRREPLRLMGVLLLSVIIQAGRIAAVFVIALSIGEGKEFFPYLIAVPIIFLTNIIPVVGNRIGAEQGMFVLLLGLLAGVRAEAALAIALVAFGLSVLAALPGGYWIVSGRAPREKPTRKDLTT